MARFSPRLWLRWVYRQALDQLMIQPNLQEDRRSVIVFSPHQDDETLGCGGTIIGKTVAGVDVSIVYMTDGCQSHAHLISNEELTAARRGEAIAACRVLGVAEDDLYFLDFEDGRLHEHKRAAVEKVVEILHRHLPDEVFIPYHQEPTPDHNATNEIVLAALDKYPRKATIYEYPVWYWYHWPWVSVRQKTPPGTRSVLRNTVNAGLGLRMLSDFRQVVYVGDVLPRKQEALDQHKTQMTQFIPDPRWITLHDVSNGEWLSCFFQDYELLRSYSHEPSQRESGKLARRGRK